MTNQKLFSIKRYIMFILIISIIPTFYMVLETLFGNNFNTYQENKWIYVVSFNIGITAMLSIGSSLTTKVIEERIPWSKVDFTKRIIYQISILTIMSVIVMFTYSKVWYGFIQKSPNENVEIFYNIIIAIIIVLFISFIYSSKSLYHFWKHSLIKEESLQKENLNAQLEILKAQVNPHFLFNTLNGIHYLIKKDPELARETIIKFSNLLSHQIYDSQKTYIRLTDEIKYLQNYIDLEKLRQGDAVNLAVDFTYDTSHLAIPPMLYIPLVENAFKYGFASGIKPYNLEIQIKETEENLMFSCKNQYDKNALISEKNGFGLQNLKKRLELIFNQNYSLDISNQENWFIAELMINKINLLNR